MPYDCRISYKYKLLIVEGERGLIDESMCNTCSSINYFISSGSPNNIRNEYKIAAHFHEFYGILCLGVVANFARRLYVSRSEVYWGGGRQHLRHDGSCLSFYASIAWNCSRSMA